MRRRKTTELTLRNIYEKFHKPHFLKPDPLQFLSSYSDVRDREIVGLIASALALGRVTAILNIIEKVLTELPSPYRNLNEWSDEELERKFGWFVYRFYKAEDLRNLLIAIKLVLNQYGSLQNSFLSGYGKSDTSILPGLKTLYDALNQRAPLKMLPNPHKNSACKRWMLYLRWMVRTDDIDPGGWNDVSPSKLIIPLDTHILKVSSLLKLTDRKDGSIKTAIDITETLKKYDSDDPIRFDFSLTRPGIHPLLDYSDLSMKDF